MTINITFDKGVGRQLFKLLHACILLITLGTACSAGIAHAQSSPQLDTIVGSKDIEISSVTSDLTIVLKPQARCFFGDFDAIVQDLYHAGEDTELLLTIEPILPTDSSPPLFSHSVLKGFQIAKDGYEITVQLPKTAPQSPEVVGLFLCSHSSDTKSCRNKAVVPYAEIFDSYRGAQNPETGGFYLAQARPTNVTDKLYYFRWLVNYGDHLAVPEKAMSDNRYRAFEDFARSVNTKGAQEVISRTRFLGAALGSLPPRVSGGGIEVFLPYYSPQKCR